MISPAACGVLFSARTTPHHPAALAEPRGTLVEPWWNPGGTLVEPWWNPGGTLVEPWWNPRGTLAQGRPGPPRSLSGLRPQSFQLLGKNKTHVHFSKWTFCKSPCPSQIETRATVNQFFLSFPPALQASRLPHPRGLEASFLRRGVFFV